MPSQPVLQTSSVMTTARMFLVSAVMVMALVQVAEGLLPAASGPALTAPARWHCRRTMSVTHARKRGASSKKEREVDPFDPEGIDGSFLFRPPSTNDEDDEYYRNAPTSESDQRLFVLVLTIPFLLQASGERDCRLKDPRRLPLHLSAPTLNPTPHTHTLTHQ